jgi:hypothetical protein
MSQHLSPEWSRLFGHRVYRTESGCLEYTGCRDRFGYGRMSFRGRSGQLSHRVSSLVSLGELERGAVVLHACDNPSCVNPDHLLVGSQADNMRDAGKKARLPHGLRHWDCRISDADVLIIQSSPIRNRDLAAKHGVSADYIRKIKKDRVRKVQCK